MTSRRTIGASDNAAVLGGMRAKNNGRYNGNGREWRTPPEVFEPLHAEFHFTLDPCTTADNPLGTPRFFTEADNGLAREWWHGLEPERVFMNPPYGREVGAWTKKAREQSAQGVLVVGLLPASTDLAWWHEDVIGADAEIRFIRGRVRFLTDGPYRASGFFASAIVVWLPFTKAFVVPVSLAFSGLSWPDRTSAAARGRADHGSPLGANTQNAQSVAENVKP